MNEKTIHNLGVKAMIESRCGLLCSECEYRKTVACTGCTDMEKPFWGDSCPVKSCCEAKKHSHCGECEEFACSLLHSFAYDAKQGDNGTRLEHCRKWRQGCGKGDGEL